MAISRWVWNISTTDFAQPLCATNSSIWPSSRWKKISLYLNRVSRVATSLWCLLAYRCAPPSIPHSSSGSLQCHHLETLEKIFTVTSGYCLFINAFLNDGESLEIKHETVRCCTPGTVRQITFWSHAGALILQEVYSAKLFPSSTYALKSLRHKLAQLLVGPGPNIITAKFWCNTLQLPD